MKGIVLYYSATGNTQKIAMAIHSGMKMVIDNCDIASIKEFNQQQLSKYDVIGIGSPVWGFREPTNMKWFIYNLPDLDGKLCFPFCVHGASPEGYFYSITRSLKKKGMTIIGYQDWYGSVYQVRHMPKPYLTDLHPDEIDLQEALEFGHQMAERALKISTGETDLIPNLPKGESADPLWKPRIPGKARQLPTRNINSEKCLYPKCTVCVDNCPVNAIDYLKFPLSIKQNCINCNFCNRLCPVGAVEVDYPPSDIIQRKVNTEKCKYPDCTLCIDHCPTGAIDFSVNPPVFSWKCEHDDLCWAVCPEGAIEVNDEEHCKVVIMKDNEHIFAKALSRAEEAGRFRRLVPLDEVGWDTPIYTIKKHPVINIADID